jgi:hypothetical protein
MRRLDPRHASVKAYGPRRKHRRLGAQALSILLASFVPCMIRGIGDRGELMEVEA